MRFRRNVSSYGVLKCVLVLALLTSYYPPVVILLLAALNGRRRRTYLPSSVADPVWRERRFTLTEVKGLTDDGLSLHLTRVVPRECARKDGTLVEKTLHKLSSQSTHTLEQVFSCNFLKILEERRFVQFFGETMSGSLE